MKHTLIFKRYLLEIPSFRLITRYFLSNNTTAVKVKKVRSFKTDRQGYRKRKFTTLHQSLLRCILFTSIALAHWTFKKCSFFFIREEPSLKSSYFASHGKHRPAECNKRGWKSLSVEITRPSVRKQEIKRLKEEISNTLMEKTLKSLRLI